VAIGVLIIIVTLLLSSTAFADETTTVTIVSTNDFHGALIGRVHSWSHGDVVGSADYLTGYINIVREENPGGVIWLDAGDSMQGTLISNYFGGASTIEVFNAAGVAAMAVGNHEFDWGQDVLLDRVQQAKFPFLTSNVFTDKYQNPNNGLGGRPQWAKTYEVVKANGIKVGVIGISLPSTPDVTNPVNIPDLTFTDPAAAVADMLLKVEGQSDMIVVLAHIGGYWPDFGELADFVCGLDPEKIDLVVSGHSHGRVDDVICDIPVIQSYSSGTAFSRVDFEVDASTGEVVDYTMNSYPVTTYNTYYGGPASYRRWDTGEYQEVVPDPTITAIVAEYEAEIASLQNMLIGETTTAITRNYRYESEMGDWVTDIMKEFDSGIDFAFTNSGGLREDIDAGPITFGEVFTALPFDNTLVVVELTGDEVIQVLFEGIQGDHGVIQVSGLNFAFDYGTAAEFDSVIVGDVIDLDTGLPLDPGTTYFVAVNDFMAAGGDGYTTLGANPQVNSYVLVRDMVVDWVEANSPFSPPDPAVELRMIITGTPPS
jgi:2',3'-cyclic-nucleotide 2'-phosphodiesterase (5'-nucleotidase family)